ncbi:T-cell leukemia translocation-altered gene protein isoform X1 [Echinops telfairi]|uniref:T-cell leukemia translocation-altered gene protein isoform X1 n=1 Tax=Echinops telfairi TaxID=9371 RepID=A0AC55DNL6_ECHTE|nr:T-cell leukemia translocation-altered gene protein isoform X1 [Echinops telfairi]
MAEPWLGQSLQALPATVLGGLGALCSEFLRDWEAQDMRVTLFKLLLLWLVLSLLGIQLAWGFYGSTVTGLYHRPARCSSGSVPAPQVWAARTDPHLMVPRTFPPGFSPGFWQLPAISGSSPLIEASPWHFIT